MSCLQSNFLDSETETESEWYLPGAKERYFHALVLVSISDQPRASQIAQETLGSQQEFALETLTHGQHCGQELEPMVPPWPRPVPCMTQHLGGFFTQALAPNIGLTPNKSV